MRADDELNAIEEVAAAWMVERDGGWTPAREREFRRWCEADARHAAAFTALAETWKLLGEASPANGTEERGEAGATRGRGRSAAWVAVTLAAAAALAMAFFVGAERQAGAGGDAGYALTAATEVGALRTIELPDGSAIQLNTDSAVEVRFEADERRVRLTRGEAHFTVAKDRARPFVVGAAGVNVRVVGTVFNVRLRSESVDVLVTEGKVRVQPPLGESRAAAATSELSAGQRVSLALNGAAERSATAPVAVTPAEVRQTLAWQARRLDFDATPLSEIVAEINRHNRHKLIVADAELNGRRFGGSFPADDYGTLVRMLEADFGVVAERRESETLLRRRRN